MNKKIQVIMLTILFLMNIAPVALAENKPNDDHLYTYLTDENIYKEYKNASLNTRKKMKVTAYKDSEESTINVDLITNIISKISSVLED